MPVLIHFPRFFKVEYILAMIDTKIIVSEKMSNNLDKNNISGK